jgi:hypothetical protein
MLVHAHNRSIDHLHGGIMSSRQRIHDLVPDTSPPPANKPIVASRMGTVALGILQPAARTAAASPKIIAMPFLTRFIGIPPVLMPDDSSLPQQAVNRPHWSANGNKADQPTNTCEVSS